MARPFITCQLAGRLESLRGHGGPDSVAAQRLAPTRFFADRWQRRPPIANYSHQGFESIRSLSLFSVSPMGSIHWSSSENEGNGPSFRHHPARLQLSRHSPCDEMPAEFPDGAPSHDFASHWQEPPRNRERHLRGEGTSFGRFPAKHLQPTYSRMTPAKRQEDSLRVARGAISIERLTCCRAWA